ncbi:MAG: hypothetical protein EOO08_02415 [Chitinophagaceae bacterium]|nr:MAG: hypothetical protein EOO08_02415 [Chitinophagaceae bacterium]
MRSLLFLPLLLLARTALAQPAPIQPNLVPWSSIGSSGRMAFSADGQHLLFTAGKQVLIYDLKKRAMLASVPGVSEDVLEVSATEPYFYTWAAGSVQKRSLPLGTLVEATSLPAGSEALTDLVVEVDADNGTLFTATGYEGRKAVIGFNGKGLLHTIRGLPSGEKINAICRRNGSTWALTSHGLWRQRDSLFEKVALAGEADYANARFHADTLVILGRTAISWYDTRAARLIRQTAIPGFFASDATDTKASILSFHHPFAIDRSGKVWLTDTRPIYEAQALHYPPYAIALIGDAIEYPFRSVERGSNALKYMDRALAYHAGHEMLAVAGGLDEIELLHRQQGPLFTIARTSLQVEGLRFTARPGRILLRVSAMRAAPALLLDLGNGRLETIATFDDRYLIPGNPSFTDAKPAGVGERLYRGNTGQWVEQPFLRYNGEVPLQYDSDENDRLYLPGGKTVMISAAGLLEYRDPSGKVLRSMQLSPLDHDLYGVVNDKELQLNKAKKIPFTDRHYIKRVQFDSASGLLYVKIMDRYSVSEGTLTVVDLEKKTVVFQNTGVDLLLLPGGQSFLTEDGIFELRSLRTQTYFGGKAPRSASDYILNRDATKVYALGWKGHPQPFVYDIAQKTWTELSPFEADELHADPNADRVFAISKEAGVAVWDTKTNNLLARIVVAGNRNNDRLDQLDASYLVLLPDGSYMGQNKYYQLLQLQQGGKAIGLSEMDGIFHRPDKVLRALGYANASAVGLLEKIAERRSSRFSGRFPTDDARIDQLAALPFYHPANRIALQVAVPASRSNNGLMAYANGTALFAKPLPVGGKTSIPLDVALVDAATHLRVCLVDAEGKETPGDYFYLQGKAVEDRDLYVLGIGVSDYRDARYNLKYAAKDMNDLAEFLRTTSSYRNVRLRTWQDARVTTSLPDSIRAALKDARPQDVVLCYFAGHGLLDKANSYFLATHDQDFSDPAKGGLPIDAVSAALASGDARKKLLVIDACHSGLVEDLVSGASAAAADSSGQSAVVRRGIEAPGRGTKASDLYFSFQHFGQGSGLDILAASAGNEYALELGALKNGVFTYSMLQALKTGAADNNGDKKISLGELQRYVAANTARLTRGAQQPTFRQANLYQDMALFAAGDTYLEKLMAAARANDPDALQAMLATGSVDVKAVDANGFTALHYAAREGSLQAAQYLVRNGSSLTARTPIGATPLYLAVYNNHYRLAYFLMANGSGTADFYEWQKNELPKRIDTAMAGLLQRFGAIRDEQARYYALARALSAGNLQGADSVLQQGRLDWDKPLIIEGIPVLFSPVYDDKVDAARWAIERGASPDSRSFPDRWTALMIAAYRGNEAMVRMLIEKGARKTARDGSGRTAADYARLGGRTALLPLLTE